VALAVAVMVVALIHQQIPQQEARILAAAVEQAEMGQALMAAQALLFCVIQTLAQLLLAQV
jgi:hypothetical protein